MKYTNRRVILILLLFITTAINVFGIQPRYRYRDNVAPFILLTDSLKVKNVQIDINLTNASQAHQNLQYTIEITQPSDSLFLVASEACNLKVSLDGYSLNIDSLKKNRLNLDSISYLRSMWYADNPYLFELKKGIHQLDLSFDVSTNIIRGDIMYRYNTDFNLENLRKAKSIDNIVIKVASDIDDDNVTYSIGGVSHKLENQQTMVYKKVPDYYLYISYSPSPMLPIIPQVWVGILIVILLFVLDIYIVAKKMNRDENKKRFLPLISISLLTPIAWFLIYYFVTFIIDRILGEYSCYFESPDLYDYIFSILMYPFFAIFLFITLFLVDYYYRFLSKRGSK